MKWEMLENVCFASWVGFSLMKWPVGGVSLGNEKEFFSETFCDKIYTKLLIRSLDLYFVSEMPEIHLHFGDHQITIDLRLCTAI